jgi:Arc/MetJ-type ribon-helix-helix transcriptional regulator
MTGAKDPMVKSEAIRAGVRAVESDDDMRESLLAILRSMDDQELATFVRAMAGSINDDPESIMKAIARASRTDEVRARAHDVVRQLRVDQRAGT